MNWKDHPFAIAVTASVATLMVVATVVFTAIIPTWLKAKENEVSALQAQVEDLQKQISELQAKPAQEQKEREALVAKLRELETENIKLRRALDRGDQENLFSVDDVYPKGFRAVRIGDRIEVITQAYKDSADVKDEDDWVSVRLKNPEFCSMITYYYNDTAAIKTVVSVLFHLRVAQVELVKTQLIKKYDLPSSETTKHSVKQSRWMVQGRTLVLSSDGRLQIL
jgi:Tfp pilus assembly protein FimV